MDSSYSANTLWPEEQLIALLTPHSSNETVQCDSNNINNNDNINSVQSTGLTANNNDSSCSYTNKITSSSCSIPYPLLEDNISWITYKDFVQKRKINESNNAGNNSNDGNVSVLNSIAPTAVIPATADSRSPHCITEILFSFPPAQQQQTTTTAASLVTTSSINNSNKNQIQESTVLDNTTLTAASEAVVAVDYSVPATVEVRGMTSLPQCCYNFILPRNNNNNNSGNNNNSSSSSSSGCDDNYCHSENYLDCSYIGREVSTNIIIAIVTYNILTAGSKTYYS